MDASVTELKSMERLFDRLFPLTRSITGPGLRESLDIIGEYMPLERFSLPSGRKVFDWDIPKEWRIYEAWIEGPDGKRVVDVANHNLHIVNYSVSVDREMDLEELKRHLFTLPQLPDAIPYITSYYKERWGFCLSHREMELLQPGTYKVVIRSEHVDGELNFAHAILPGESDKEILISSYLCHPSMANNELSGPIVLAFLFDRLSRWSSRRFTYRFVLAPETIGSLAYLSVFGDQLTARLAGGMVLTCMGGGEPLSYKFSRRGNSGLDRLMKHLSACGAEGGIRTRPFTPINGSDERQYNSPGFNLPVGQMSRLLHNGFAEYHNSLDTKEVMTVEALQRSVDELERILRSLELDGYYINTKPFGEVKLDKHGLYPDINSPLTWNYSSNNVVDHRTQLNRVLTLLNYADGEHSLVDIAQLCQCSVAELEPIVRLLKEKEIIRGPYLEKRGLFE